MFCSVLFRVAVLAFLDMIVVSKTGLHRSCAVNFDHFQARIFGYCTVIYFIFSPLDGRNILLQHLDNASPCAVLLDEKMRSFINVTSNVR